ncbi:hypothetical protein ACFYRC_33175 [Streptomyces sp. NPDC005279]|uniref:hypothetical protein n=1 Tax=Streptomyces sp. NPDC005279 TaxID=3364712 RepID=UPI0036A6E085
MGAGVLSVETGMRMLIDAGYPIDDAQAEIQRIRARSSDAAAASPTRPETTLPYAHTSDFLKQTARQTATCRVRR